MGKGMSASKRARRTGRWATTMTKWLISKMAARPKWQLVSFLGPDGGESRGVVDLLAIRKDHRAAGRTVRRGDRFELVLIQIKGGDAAWPSATDVRRLRDVAKHHRATAIVLAAWHPGSRPFLYRLAAGRAAWRAVAPEVLFG